MIPISAKVIKSAVPPWLTNTSGIPESGKTPSIAPMFTND